ncbi:hypothetical protein [Persephonella sp. IF05-L8]|uniref:hypothetical protein n=1 Tax=Persephonella sp. IF05-L8 TaxID=1158338 RepID=UPI00068F4556
MMSEKLFQLRRFYFASLYFSLFYIALLIIIFKGRNIQPVEFSSLDYIVLGIISLVPAAIFFIKQIKYVYEKNIYFVMLIFGEIPLIIGFIYSLIKGNSIYLIISYPVFLLGYLLLLPTKKAVEGK